MAVTSNQALTIDIVTPERRVYSGPAEFVVLPGVEGELGILRNHAPLLSRLRPGEIKISRRDAVEYCLITEGFLEVRANRVSVAAESAIMAPDINLQETTTERDNALAEVSQAKDETARTRAETRLKQASMKLALAEKARRSGTEKK